MITKCQMDRLSLHHWLLFVAALLVLAGCTAVQVPPDSAQDTTAEGTTAGSTPLADHQTPAPSASPLLTETVEPEVEPVQADATAPVTLTPTEPPEAVEVAPDGTTVEISSLMPSGPGIQQYLVTADAGQVLAVDVSSDGVLLSLIIESPSGSRWIPEMMTSGDGYITGHELTVPETGDYVIKLGKADHTPSTNFVITFTLVEPTAASSGSEPPTPTTGEVEANGITIAYESYGSAEDEAILLIAGVGMPLAGWPIELVEELTNRGYRVVRFDNRDVGLSTKMSEAGLPDEEAIAAALEAGEPAPMPYTLRDMAADAIGLMDALEIQQAHIVGISMGGAIAQLIAIDYPQRILSLTTIAADSGNPDLPVIANPEAFAGVPPQPATVDKEAFVAWQVATWQALAGPTYPVDEAILREEAERDFERGFDPEALVRHQTVSFLGHIESAGYRLNNLQKIKVPTVVVQGTEDPLVPVESAEDIAARVPNADLRLIPGLGHYVPVELVPEFADAITDAAGRA
jgi:pimeloyl-ACP methyl ester carboxylesterase